jgi:hypothetical protein
MHLSQVASRLGYRDRMKRRSLRTKAGIGAMCLAAGTAWAQPNLLMQSPMREWTAWIRDVRPVKASVRAISSPLTNEEWAIERVYIVLFRLTQNCEAFGYAINADPFLETNLRLSGLGWVGLTIMPNHADNQRGQAVLGSVDMAFEKHGKALCDAFHRRLGRDGDLVTPLRRFTEGNTAPYKYTNIVMWSKAEICAQPEKFWEADWTNPQSRAAVMQAQKHFCG